MKLRRFFFTQSLVLRRSVLRSNAGAQNDQTVSQILATLEWL